VKRAAVMVVLIASCAKPVARTPVRPTPETSPGALPASDVSTEAGSSSGPNEEGAVPIIAGNPHPFDVLDTALNKSAPVRVAPTLACEISLGKLATMGPGTRPLKDEATEFALHDDQGSEVLSIRGDLLAEVSVGDANVLTTAFAQTDSPLGVIPGSRLQRCNAPGAVTLRGLHLRRWTASEVAFADADALFEAAACRGSVRWTRDVEARAVWPSVVYAFASTDNHARQRITVLAPRAAWFAAPLSPKKQLTPNVGSFTYVSLPVEPGTVKSIALELTETAMLAFHGGDGDGRIVTMSAPDPKEAPAVRVVIDIDEDGVKATASRLSASPALDDTFAPASAVGGKPDATAVCTRFQ